MSLRCRPAVTSFITAFTLLLGGCADKAPSIRQETVVFGTHVVITVADGENAAVAAMAIDAIFTAYQDMHHRFYPWREGELRTVNQAVAAAQLPLEISTTMAAMMQQAKKYSRLSEGLFNPAIGNLVELWGFHAAPPYPNSRPPPATAVRAWAANPPSMEAVKIHGVTLLAAPASAQFDFGALAKGVALDRARDILTAHDIKNALIDVGGGVLAMGKNGDRRWRVALFADRKKPPLATVELNNGEAVATSGGSERFFIYEGRRYHHILDPRNGEPAVMRQVAIVINADAAAAGAISDAAATALVIAADDEAKRIMENFNISLAWRIGEKKRQITPALEKRLKESD